LLFFRRDDAGERREWFNQWFEGRGGGNVNLGKGKDRNSHLYDEGRVGNVSG
jgi:hypothetical protein